MVRFLSVLSMVFALVISFDSFAQTFEGNDVNYFSGKENNQPQQNIADRVKDWSESKPKLKTDAQVMREKRKMPDNWKEMTSEEQIKYVNGVFEDRFILMTGNIRAVKTGSGKEICSLRLLLTNNSSRKIKKIFVKYHWGDTSTYVSFEGIDPVKMAASDIALFGSVCSKEVMDGADYEVTTCQVEGLTEEQCKLRLFPL